MDNLWDEAKHTPEYIHNISSQHWKKLRKEIIADRGRKCERCGLAYFSENLALHHKHYDTLGNESAADVELLCKKCHGIADAERARHVDQKNAIALSSARLDGWASKKYGDDWYERMDSHDVWEEFDNWLENRRYD